MNSMRPAFLLAVVYLFVAIFLSGVWPLWLDEVLQLIDTRDGTAFDMLLRLPSHHAGSAPLGYLVQHASLQLTSYSMVAARLPAAIFGAASVFVVALLATELDVARGWLAALIFAMFPLTLRYSAEGRMYSQALFFSTLATLLYVRYARDPRWTIGVGYCAALIAAAYTQPFASSVGLALFLWSLFNDESKVAIFGCLSFMVTVAAFLPWHFWADQIYLAAAGDQLPHFTLSIKTPLMIFRELAGLGYWGSGVLLILCVIGVRRRVVPSRVLSFVALMVAVPMVVILFTDALFDYFIAARQFIWVLPAIAILAAAAVEKRTGVLLFLLAVIALRQNIVFYTAPKEDWHAAADTIAAKVDLGARLEVAPPEQKTLYTFFRPELRNADDGSAAVLAVTPYSTPCFRESAIDKLTREGCQPIQGETVGKSEIILFRCDPSSLP